MTAPRKSATELLREMLSRSSEDSRWIRTLPSPQVAAETASPETVSWRLSANGPGWAAVRSHLLAETIVFLRDESVPLPPTAAGLVNYTRAELEILRSATETALREIHAWKRAFGGRIESLPADLTPKQSSSQLAELPQVGGNDDGAA